MLEYAYPNAGFGELLPLLGEDPDVADAVAHLFCQRVADLVKRGLYREYVEREENLRYLRGRPLFLLNETINRGLRHQIYARHTELTADVWVNRILLLALTAISRTGPASSATSDLLRWDIAHFSEVALDYASGSAARSLNRLNAHYEPTLALAQFILRCVSFAEGGREPSATTSPSSILENAPRGSREGSWLSPQPTSRKRAVLLRRDDGGRVSTFSRSARGSILSARAHARDIRGGGLGWALPDPEPGEAPVNASSRHRNADVRPATPRAAGRGASRGGRSTD